MGFHYQSKSTEFVTFNFRLPDWEQYEQTLVNGDKPAWVVNFNATRKGRDFVVIDLDDWIEIEEELKARSKA